MLNPSSLTVLYHIVKLNKRTKRMSCEGIMIPRSRDGARWLYILTKRMSRWFGAETDTVLPQVHDGGLGVVAMDEGQGANKGVLVDEYLVKTLRPEDEGKALSDQNHHTSSLSPLNTDGLKLM
nr:kinesin motor domain-containing protein [Tanacetum cinerariifolium]